MYGTPFRIAPFDTGPFQIPHSFDMWIRYHKSISKRKGFNMKVSSALKSAIVVSACVFALVIAVGCASGTSASSSTASEGGASSEAAASSESAEPSAQSASAEAASAESAYAEAASGEAAPGSDQSAEASSAEASSPEASSADGSQVFSGTVRVCTAEELIELQAIDIDPAAAGGGGTYAVLVFDEPTDVTGMSADGSGERTESSNMLGIAEHTDYESFVVEYGDLDACKALDGQHVTLSAKAQDIMFPSDVRLPIGEPSANTVEILS